MSRVRFVTAIAVASHVLLEPSDRVLREIEGVAGFPIERARALLHIILSHHGRREHGGPVTPCTREAAPVHAMDAVSGQAGSFERVEIAMTAGQRWSSYDRVLGTCVFVE